jgi:beta-lactam-binding protein with PASTA domain
MMFKNWFAQRFDLGSLEKHMGSRLRFFISFAAGLIVFVGVIALAVFFMAVRGAEQTMVPDVQDMDIIEALLELQVKELYPRIQQRNSQSASDRGRILEQSPEPGTIVKAGRRIRLVVSQGLMVSNMDNSVGRNIDEVRVDIQTLFASGGRAGAVPGLPLLSLKEPFMYQYSPEPPGIILQQSPEPGSPIFGPTVLNLVISRGLEREMITVPNLTGLSIDKALALLGETGAPFVFSHRPPQGGEKPETILSQSPEALAVAPAATELSLVAGSPLALAGNEVFALFSYSLPENPYPLPVSLEAVLPAGERRTLITVNHPGGSFMVPYRLPAGSTLILSMLDRELYREEVVFPVEALSLEQL